MSMVKSELEVDLKEGETEAWFDVVSSSEGYVNLYFSKLFGYILTNPTSYFSWYGDAHMNEDNAEASIHPGNPLLTVQIVIVVGVALAVLGGGLAYYFRNQRKGPSPKPSASKKKK